ncbi:MAG: tetratricopeptide repeat protein [Armatimonadetes bacterium]|nr:tetratricopeptide repeat protein [Armatimonadota bacterium]
MSSRRRPPLPARSPATPPPRASRLRPGPAIAALIVALGYGGWSWHEYERPGRVHERRGVEDAAAGRFHEAERQWRQGVREDPTFPGCYEHLGDLYQQVRDYPDAAADFQAAARLNPRDGTLFLRLARAQQSAGDLPAAAASAQRAAQLRPDDGEALGLYGMLEGKGKHMPQALAALRRARQLRPDDRDDLLALVNLEMDVPDMDAAERDLTPWLKAHPDDAEACYFMAVIYNQKPRTPDNLQAGIGYAERALAGMARDPRPYALLGQLYLDVNRPQDALRTFQIAAQLLPNDEGVLHGLVGCYTRLGQSRQAAAAAARLQTETARHDRIAHLQEVMRFNHADVASGLELARLEEEDGDLRQAQQYYVALVQTASRDPRTHAALAAFLRRIGRPELAKQAARLDFTP